MGNTQVNDWVMEILSGAQSGDTQAIIIAGLSGALALILILMVIIAVMGRKDKSAISQAEPEKEGAPKSAKPEIAMQAETADTSADVNKPVYAESDDSQNAEMPQTDDFMIFRRGERQTIQRKDEIMPTSEGLSIEDNLQLIEREMIKLRDMFKQGHVTRDVYVDETRNLYHQARAISALK